MTLAETIQIGPHTPDTDEFVPGQQDVADGFAETGFTFTFNKTEKNSGTPHLLPFNSENNTVSVSAYNGSTAYGDRRGAVINYAHKVGEVVVDWFADESNATAGITRVSDNTDITSKTVSGTSTTFSNLRLSANTDYWVWIDNGTERYDSDIAFPKSSGDLTLTGGVNDTNGYCYVGDVTAKRAAAKSGNLIVEPAYPSDVYEWGAVFFDADADGETLNVYAEEYDGTNWVEIAGPMKPGDEIPADPSRNVRFRIEYSRTNTANDPRLREIARREVFKGA